MTIKIIASAVRLLVLFYLGAVLTGCDDSSHNGQKAMLKLGLITNNPNGLRNIQGFKNGMTALGYIENDNISYLSTEAPVKKTELEKTIKKMIAAKVDLIFTAGTPTGIAAHSVTAQSAIPVVFGVIADPIAAGVMQDLTKPGGNMTGVMLSQNQGRRLEFLLQIVPGTNKVLVPYNPDDAAPRSAVSQIEAVATGLGVELVKGEARNDNAVSELLGNLPDNIDAIFLVPDSTVNRRLTDILTVAEAKKLPVSGPSTAQVEEGALTTYGFVHHEVGAQAARIADQIIRGANPGELPVETAEFFLSINLQSANAIDLKISDEILQQADRIIR